MGAVTRPVGPLPPRVYWVRRVVVLALVLLIAFLASVVVRAVAGNGDEGAAGASGAADTATGSRASADKAEVVASKDADAKRADAKDADAKKADAKAGDPDADAATDAEDGEAPAKDSAEGAATPECGKDDLRVVLASDRSTYPAGTKPVFTLEVRNVAEVPCLVDVTDVTRELLIVSGPARVWSSADCSEADPRLLLLGPGQTDAKELAWSRVRSNEDCTLVDVEAKPGTYRATASILGRSSKELVFVLS